jgi:hypothetical protein
LIYKVYKVYHQGRNDEERNGEDERRGERKEKECWSSNDALLHSPISP